jgi:hypothetical protein
MEPYSQEPPTGPYPEPYQSDPIHIIPSYLSKIHFDIDIFNIHFWFKPFGLFWYTHFLRKF